MAIVVSVTHAIVDIKPISPISHWTPVSFNFNMNQLVKMKRAKARAYPVGKK